ncbi:putative two-component response regulator [Nitrincola lacisaponensis]|uniref:diguanylate cyclase n=2 Tax=Nitrincola lacisaponensis TaxID=267850 RepID=A0A063Y6J9_9GAMM|nr:GGDEF domain-containing protein [Nitrincola lacisaponensis]KDE41329.1 putative two-component response regulator [Nitrincola lacisaponensis]
MSKIAWRPQLKMSVTLLVVVLGMLLVFSLALVLSLGLLRDISAQTRATAEEYLPELVRTQQDALKVEKISSYLDAAYRVQNAAEERQYRLLSQVLIHSFMLEQDDYLIAEANNIMFDIRELLSIRHTQRQLQQEMLDILNDAGNGSLDYYRGLLAGLPVQSIREPFISEPLQQLQALLPVEAYGELLYRVRFVVDLNLQLDWLVEDTHQRIEHLSAYLSTDAALKARQITTEVGKDALMVSNYFLILIALLIIFSVVILLSFQRLILSPVQELVHGLHSIENQGGQPITLRRVCFHELDVIRQAIEGYSQLMHRLQQANAELERLSQQDGLTGLANRRSLDQVIDVEVGRALRYHHPLSVLMIDIDHFKLLNDRYGHQIGDESLKALAEVLVGFAQRPGELAARFGGEEFILVLPETTADAAMRIAELLRERCQQIRMLPDGSLNLSVSIGVASFRQGVTDSAALLLRHADQALYKAKAAGRNCCRLYQ